MKKIAQIQAKNAAAQKLVENYASSSEDEGELDETRILDLLYEHYQPPSERSSANSSNGHSMGRTATFLQNALHSGAATCLICIGSIRRVEAIWSCQSCYCFFHLNCIQRWANDSLMQMKTKVEQQNGEQGYYNFMGEYVPPKRHKQLHWCCPQCRKEYLPGERPKQYECFCGKELDPKPEPFLVPHSCGEICSKLLQPKCGHDCKLLCHPGPCPPCAQLAHSSCLCGKSAPRSMRCIDKHWQCQQICNELLKCGKHLCNQICHRPGQCPPCTNKSKQPCECNREVKTVNCSELKWKCKRVCGAAYSCGLHFCERVCHYGSCGDCPLGLPRTCPCGKSSKVGPCSLAIDTCGDTCQKLLPCGLHTCTQRCHRGSCNLCLVITKKRCRCGQHEKELPCSKEFTCETKCKRMRDCGKHVCNRKCCGDQCPPCEKICGKQLSCNKHKCQSVCHNGPCYPCKLESQVNCRCGKTRKSVPCGRERNARIICLELCRITSKCHHSVKHRCHKGECPPCGQPCNLPNDISGCGHICKARCHAAIRVPISSASAKKYEYKAQPHPRCEQSVNVTCIGGHEVAMWPCWNSKPSSCQRKCARKLKCGNHKCNLVCHAVPNLQDMNEQSGCAKCEEGCAVPRPSGCIHACPRSCHPPPCMPCNVIIKSKCHCGLNQVVYKCNEFFDEKSTIQEIVERQQKFRSCGNRCLKNFACGHRCMTTCHPGKCPNPELCRKKVRIYCKCKRIKLEISCDKNRAGQVSLDCDAYCAAERQRVEAAERQEIEQKLLEEDRKRRIELEKFEQKFGKRKQRERKLIETEPAKPLINWHRLAIYGLALLAVLAAIGIGFYADS
ncbi:NF-X1-type zinc finger protein NFXL1 [Scaptodrosophila lebanonensis]|uniref:NF-X1-type zinc finger protein NFXL1 n=1 Tax=Drosophila lebanonensis TaxID=7225 RepID=A0A6J2TIB9_DROLE|nr:NF-X1-type zinc finger protein NFXL1 [Scaptodrosophila lebanonensis]